MAWRKNFKTTNTTGQYSAIPGNAGMDSGTPTTPGFGNYSTPLPEVYSGHPNRVDRYNQYEAMDLDSEVNAALDILAEFCTQTDQINQLPFDIHYNDQASDTEITIITEQLNAWCKLNKINQRVFKMFRNTLKYGDQVFLRDPETFELYWVEPKDVVKVIVNESEGKKPEQYILKNVNVNFENLTATQLPNQTDWNTSPAGGEGANIQSNYAQNTGSRFSNTQDEKPIEGQHIVHLSLTEGLDPNWPFGTSVLENIFKVFKQKELLEDAIIIYRISRAPERRVFYIDVGSMPPHMAMSFVERVKNEIHQRRIPTQTGGGQNVVDSTYNPLSQNEDYFFPQTAEGRGSKVETLPGGSNLGEIDDLKFFTNKMFRGLRIPSSYLPTGFDDTNGSYTDGRVGTALIQEHRFNEYCKRLQRMIEETLDREFKVFMAWRGFNIDNSLFDIKFNDPQNFAAYRQQELDSGRISAFTQLEGTPYLSKRFMMKRFLGLTEAEMLENEEMWREETGNSSISGSAQTDLRGAGITPGGLDSDLGTADISNLDLGDDEGAADTGIEDLDTDVTADIDAGEETE